MWPFVAHMVGRLMGTQRQGKARQRQGKGLAEEGIFAAVLLGNSFENSFFGKLVYGLMGFRNIRNCVRHEVGFLQGG